MEKLPKIKIKKPMRETDLFINFLHHPYYPQHKNLIFSAFPILKLLLKKSNDKKKTIKKFILDFYETHQNKIDKIVEQNKIAIKQKGNLVLTMLSNLTDYHWAKPVVYYAFPTILPFSPFSKNKFYFSILGQIRGKNDKNILFIAAHEISHFIFYDFLKKTKKESELNENAKNYLKEALAAVLLNQKPLCAILKLKNYSGNPELHNIKIQRLNGEVNAFVDFLQEYYQTNKIKKKKHFGIFLQEIIELLKPAAAEFSKKRMVWNRYGKRLSENAEALLDYQKPIKIKG